MEVGGCNCLVFRYIDITFTIKSSFCEVDGSIDLYVYFSVCRLKKAKRCRSRPNPLTSSRCVVPAFLCKGIRPATL